ncbi:TetR/AcrR family transcriptional regulator [Adhaeribacter soli]|uniref:TetR/AcrR family transcriptional regulator n=1 Tax=Adhaeribacter soli TaxID=2607655 RepID=A0A5N1J655_9BACT|nr:TetR/AcrR family transcriptional regulator [Adhaeribacter soli]
MLCCITSKVDKREHILEIAEGLFAEYGYEGASTRMLAKEAGVNVAMISYYFGSKEKLFEALVEKRTSFAREQIASLSREEQDPWQKLNAVIDLNVDRILSDQQFYRILYREVSLQQRSQLGANLVAILMKNVKGLIALIQAGIKAKAFRPVDPELTVATLIGTIFHTTMTTALAHLLLNGNPDGSSVTDEKFAQRLKDHLKDLLQAHLRPI